jgi:hypothetical protein
MDQQETHNSTEVASPTQAVWGTLTVAQQEAVLQTIVWICHQIAEEWGREGGHESGDE